MDEEVHSEASRLNFCQVELVRSRIWYPEGLWKEYWEEQITIEDWDGEGGNRRD